MPLLTALWAHRNLILFGLAALAIAGFVWWIQDLRLTIAENETTISGLQTSLQRQQEVNQENLATLDRLKADHQRELAALNTDLAGARQQTQTITVIKEKIRHVPVPAPGGTTACRPVGPRTLAAIGELRGFAEPPAADKDRAARSPSHP